MTELTSTLPPGYTARPPVRDDAQELMEILRACDIDLMGESDMSLIDFLGDWEGVDLERNAMAVFAPDGSAAAYADRDERSATVSSLYAYVRPSQMGRGLGTFLAAWGERRAREAMADAPDDERVVIRQYIHERAERTHALLSSQGYAPVRTTYIMEIDLAGPPEVSPMPNGVTARPFVPGQDEAATHDAVEEAFADLWGRPPATLEFFLNKTRRPYFDPAMWLLAEDGERIVGTVLADVIDDKGWIETVGVRRAYRGRGLALAMLQRAFANYWERGVTSIGLSVDAQSLTGATRLYERAGMRVKERYILFEKEIRPGIDRSASSA